MSRVGAGEVLDVGGGMEEGGQEKGGGALDEGGGELLPVYLPSVSLHRLSFPPFPSPPLQSSSISSPPGVTGASGWHPPGRRPPKRCTTSTPSGTDASALQRCVGGDAAEKNAEHKDGGI